MNGIDEKWQNYLSWLDARGLTSPRWVQNPHPCQSDFSSAAELKTIFISDLPLKENELLLLEKMTEALHLTRGQWTWLPAVEHPEALQAGVPNADTLDQLAVDLKKQLPVAQIFVAFGPLATRVACGKGSFREMRGRMINIDKRNILVTYHPRDLLKRIELKRDAWADLQLIIPCLHD